MENEKETFEARLARLEKIVGEAESGKLSLEESLKRYQEGKKLLDSLEKELLEAEKLLAENGPKVIEDK